MFLFIVGLFEVCMVIVGRFVGILDGDVEVVLLLVIEVNIFGCCMEILVDDVVDGENLYFGIVIVFCIIVLFLFWEIWDIIGLKFVVKVGVLLYMFGLEVEYVIKK